MTGTRRKRAGGAVGGQHDEWSYRSAILAFVLAEARQGVERRALAELRFGGRPAAEEADLVSAALDDLLREGHVRLCGEKIFPAHGDSEALR